MRRTWKGMAAMGSFVLWMGYKRLSKQKKQRIQSTDNGKVTIFVVRHGKTMLNKLDRVQGWADAVLTPEGEDVVRMAGRGLKDIAFTAAYSSDSGRAVQTARLILDENETASHVDLETDKRLRELNFGSFEGDSNQKVIQEIAEHNGLTLEEFRDVGLPQADYINSVAQLDQQHPHDATMIWPAEDYETLSTRLHQAIVDIAERERHKGGGTVLVVSHGMSARTLFDSLFDDFELPPQGLANASVSTINYRDGVFSLGTVNDLSYVEKGILNG